MRSHTPSLLLAVLSVLLLFSVSSVATAKNVRKLALCDLDGDKTHVSDFQARILILNLWATWCEPCKEEFARLEASAQQYSGQNVAFVLLSIDEDKKLASVRQYVLNTT